MSPRWQHCGVLVALLVCGATAPAAAAVIKALSGSRDAIQAAVDLAQAGDTVSIPAGTFAFSGEVVIAKSITVVGAGPTLTRLKSANSAVSKYLSLFKVTASNVTIRDLGFAGMPQGSGAVWDTGVSLSNSQNFVVHNCHFKDFGIASVSASGADCKGVISHCQIVDVFRPEINNIGYGVQVVGGEAINWNRPLDLGSDRFVFVEDCYFTGARHAIASSKGSRYVFRYNETHNPRPDNAQHIDAHGLEYGAQRGSRAFEIYGNVVDDTSGVASWVGIGIRGGDGIIANNTLLPKVNSPIYLCNRMDGSSTCNYPNLDQTRELYVWNNTYNGAPVGLTVKSSDACLFQLGRDYFYNPPKGYVPYPYPHPLLGSVVPAADAGVSDAFAKDGGVSDVSAKDTGASDSSAKDTGASDSSIARDVAVSDTAAKDVQVAPHDGGVTDAPADAADAAASPRSDAAAEGALRGGCGCGVAEEPVAHARGLLGVALFFAGGVVLSRRGGRRKRRSALWPVSSPSPSPTGTTGSTGRSAI